MNPWITLGGVVLVGLVFVLLPVMADAIARFRGTRRVRCPETGREVRVGLAVRRSALAAAFGSRRGRIDYCSLWPGRRDCRQGCAAAAVETPAEELWPRAAL